MRTVSHDLTCEECGQEVWELMHTSHHHRGVIRTCLPCAERMGLEFRPDVRHRDSIYHPDRKAA